jgi:hypothetical protein
MSWDMMIPHHSLGKTLSLGGAQISEGSTVVLFVDSDGRVLEHRHQLFIGDEGNSQHNLPCRWLGHKFVSSGRGQVFPYVYSFSFDFYFECCILLRLTL